MTDGRRGPRQKVLIVEDDTVTAWNLEYLMKNAGYEVVGPVGDVGDAKQLVKTREINAALLDVRLAKDELVFPVASMLVERGIPFVFTTAFGRQFPKENGFKEITLPKPLDSATVLKIVVFLIGQPPPRSRRQPRH